MNTNRRAFLKNLWVSVGLGLGAKKIIEPAIEWVQWILTWKEIKLSIWDIVYGEWKTHLPADTHEALVKKISEELGCPESTIHAILKQERPTGQKTDFFIGKEFGQDSWKPTILFERHTFWQSLHDKWKELWLKWEIDFPTLIYRTIHHDWSLLSQKWYHKSGQFSYWNYSEQYKKLREVFSWWKKYAQIIADKTGLDAQKIQEAIEDSALMACSWWGWQVLGKNYSEFWYNSVRELVENASTVNGMAENFTRFVKRHKWLKHNGKLYRYRTEIQKSNPNWEALAICQNGSWVKSENPDYIPHLIKYSKEYRGGSYPSGYIYDGTIGAVTGWITGYLLHLLKIRWPKIAEEYIPDMTRRRLMKIIWLWGVGWLVVRIGEKVWNLIPTVSNKSTTKNHQIGFRPQDAFENISPLRPKNPPTKIQTTILNPWLSLNEGTVKRFHTIEEAQKDANMVHLENQTELYRCKWLWSALMQTLEERKSGNNKEYLYIHKYALREIEDINEKLWAKLKKNLGMKSGFKVRIIINSALRDGAYSKKYLPNSSPNSTHNTGRAFDIAERFDLIGPDGTSMEIASQHGTLWSSIKTLLIDTLNEKHKKKIYYMREWIPPHFHCVAIEGTKLLQE